MTKTDMTRAEIQLVRSLADKRSRQETGLFVAEGEKLVCELQESAFVVREVFHTDRVSHLKTPTGCLALVEIPNWEFRAEKLRGRLVLALDEVQNPGNLGTIIRLADWFGVSDILCSEGTADCFNPKVVQATMGAITRVRVHYGDLAEMVRAATANAGGDASPLPVFGTFLEGENIYSAELPAAGIVVLGSEGRVISAEMERLVERKLFIPPFPHRDADATGAGAKAKTGANRDAAGMAGAGAGAGKPAHTKAESLNVAIAAAIICSEFRRPRT